MQQTKISEGIDSALSNAGIPEKYIPSENALKFIAFVRAAGIEEFSSPELHYKMADLLFSGKEEDWNALIECCRGIGKSTVAEYAVIFAAALGEWPGFGECNFIIFLGASAEGNVKQFFKNVASKITNSKFLNQLVTVKRVTDKEMELVNADGKELFIAGKGMNVNWRGARSPSGHRPDVLLADDILHNDSATSETIRKTIETNWFASAMPALAPKHKIVYIGTPISEDDLLHKLKNSGSFSVVRFPLCEKFPVPESEFRSIWPDRFSFQYASKMYNMFKEAGTTQLFYQEYLLQVTDLATLLVDEDSDVRWFDPTAFKKNASQYNFYITTDFATSTKKSADFSTIGVWGVSSRNDWFLVDGQCLRQTMDQNIDDLFKYVRKWDPLSVGIENSGQQGGYFSIMEERMVERNAWFTFAKKPGSKEPGIRPLTDKVHRFVTGVQPKFKQGKIWLPKPELLTRYPRFSTLVEELLHELSRFTLAGGVKALKHDDAIDLLNQLSEMEIYAPAHTEELKTTVATSDGLIWESIIGDEDYEDEEGNSNVF